MKYDPRIKDYHDIRCFASRNNRECLGKLGYFANEVSELSNIDNCIFGRCCFKDGSEFPFYYKFIDYDPDLEDIDKAYPIFVPSDVVDLTQSNRDLITLMEEKNADILCHKIYTILQPLNFIRYGSQKHRPANLILRGIKEILQAYFNERTKEK